MHWPRKAAVAHGADLDQAAIERSADSGGKSRQKRQAVDIIVRWSSGLRNSTRIRAAGAGLRHRRKTKVAKVSTKPQAGRRTGPHCASCASNGEGIEKKSETSAEVAAQLKK